MPVVIVFRQLANERTRQNGEVARGGNLVIGRQPVRIDEARLDHAEAPRVGVHLVGEALDRLLAHGFLPENPSFYDYLTPREYLDYYFSQAAAMPFGRLKVRLKKEIVTLGDVTADPIRQVGIYVEPTQWNTLIAAPDTLVIDTRNSFEVAMGTFEGALDPGIKRFGQFKEFAAQTLDPARHRKIAMFCTGGIRCEKASALLLARGFAEVYHLKGGILKYLEQMPAAESRWRGECFVFDERVALGHALRERRMERPSNE